MEYRQFNSTSLGMSPLCPGSWCFGTVSTGACETDKGTAHDELDAGTNVGETATSSGDGMSDRWVSDRLAGHDREAFVRTSNAYWRMRGIPWPRLSRNAIRSKLEDLLDRLGRIITADDEANA